MLVRLLAGLAVVPFLVGAAAAPAEDQQVAFTLHDPRIDEASALVALPGGRFATTNDSGDTGRVFTVDGTGRTVGVTTWSEAPEDVEALAQCRPGSVWVGDVGDNRRARDTVEVARAPVGPGERTVAPTTYRLVYPDGPHDAETLLCQPRTGRLYLATKEFLGGHIYALPARLDPDRPNRLRRLGRVMPMATDGTFWPDGRHLLVRGYFSAELYRWPSLERVARFDLPEQKQGEGIGVTADGRVYVSSEGVHARVLRVPLPAAVRKVLRDQPGRGEPRDPSASASPAAPEQGSQQDHATEQPAERGLWPWLLGGAVGLGVIVVLLRSLRPR